jgi:hypothetical protein
MARIIPGTTSKQEVVLRRKNAFKTEVRTNTFYTNFNRKKDEEFNSYKDNALACSCVCSYTGRGERYLY